MQLHRHTVSHDINNKTSISLNYNLSTYLWYKLIKLYIAFNKNFTCTRISYENLQRWNCGSGVFNVIKIRKKNTIFISIFGPHVVMIFLLYIIINIIIILLFNYYSRWCELQTLLINFCNFIFFILNSSSGTYKIYNEIFFSSIYLIR